AGRPIQHPHPRFPLETPLGEEYFHLRMAFSLAKRSWRGFSLILALGLFLGTVSIASGVTMVSVSNQAELTQDICHPLPSFGSVSMPPLARPESSLSMVPTLSTKTIGDALVPRILERNTAPETPPPKSLG